jgi:hypothetical protein
MFAWVGSAEDSNLAVIWQRSGAVTYKHALHDTATQVRKLAM